MWFCVFTPFLSTHFFVFLLCAQDPDDPTTFPGNQVVPHASDVSAQPPLTTHNATEIPPANMRTSLPQGYHGLPTS